MAEHHTSSEDEAPTKRPTRGATRLRQLLIRRARGEKTHVDINVDTRMPSGRYADIFKSYLGKLVFQLSFKYFWIVDVWENILFWFVLFCEKYASLNVRITIK